MREERVATVGWWVWKKQTKNEPVDGCVPGSGRATDPGPAHVQPLRSSKPSPTESVGEAGVGLGDRVGGGVDN